MTQTQEFADIAASQPFGPIRPTLAAFISRYGSQEARAAFWEAFNGR